MVAKVAGVTFAKVVAGKVVAGSSAKMSGRVGDRWGCLGAQRQVLSNFTQMDLVIILTSILIISILEIVNGLSDEH